MQLTVLTENTAGGYLQAEHGLSYLIEHNGYNLLFDTGHSNIFMQNAEKLGINLKNTIDTIALSHGHWDHGDGLQYIENKTLITHPSSFIKRFRKNGNTNIGLALSKSEIEQKFNLITSSEPYKISNDIFFLGEIPRKNNFESQTSSFVDANNKLDFVPDDSALAIIQNKQLIIITGCSHAGICNIIDYAIKTTGIKNIKAVIGGFHLKHNNKQTKLTIDYFKQLEIEHIYPSHCTELAALAAFYNTFAIEQLKTGMKIII